MDFGLAYKRPRSNYWHLVVMSLTSSASLWIAVPFFAGTGLVNGTPSFTGWPMGNGLCAASFVLVLVYLVVAARVKRATVFYTLLSLGAFPTVVGMLAIGLSITSRLVGQAGLMLVVAGLLAGVATTPLSLRSRRMWLRAEIERGSLRRCLDRKTATWDKRYDNLRAEQQLASAKPGCLIRLLPWVGPAIGMSLADIMGRANANVIIGLLATALGYVAIVNGVVQHGAHALELQRLEKAFGRPIYMAEDDNASKE